MVFMSRGDSGIGATWALLADDIESCMCNRNQHGLRWSALTFNARALHAHEHPAPSFIATQKPHVHQRAGICCSSKPRLLYMLLTVIEAVGIRVAKPTQLRLRAGIVAAAYET